MLLLAFDTSTPAVTVALHDGSQVLASHTVVDARRHGELLAPGIAQVLADARSSASDLTGIAVGVGPGPFTGLRIGLMTARAMGDALAIPVTGVCTLDVLAAAVVSAQPFLVATDARRREVYWATYDASGTRIDGPHVERPADVEWQRAFVRRRRVDVSGRVRRRAPTRISGRRCARLDGRERSRGGAATGSAVPAPAGRCRAQPSSSGRGGMNARRRPSQSTVSLEPMRWWDVDGVMDLERDLFGDECWTVAMFWSELAEPETRFYLVARDGAEIVGYAGLCAYPEESFVQTIAVKRDRQGTGIGTRLLTALIDEARRRG